MACLFGSVRRNISSTCWAPTNASMTPLGPLEAERERGLGLRVASAAASSAPGGTPVLRSVRVHVQVAHGHVWIDVTKQFHQRGQTDTGPKHLRCVRVSKLV